MRRGELRQAVRDRRDLPAEQEDGSCVEYKLKLHERDPWQAATVVRFEHYCSQLRWRMSQNGRGEATYMLGVMDDGRIIGVSRLELATTLQVLGEMCANVGACMVDVDTVDLDLRTSGPQSNIVACQVTIEGGRPGRWESKQLHWQRRVIVVVGAEQAGKSTLVGTLCSRRADSPGGTNRLRVMRHRHEIIAGKSTCSVCDHLVVVVDEQGREKLDASPQSESSSHQEDDEFGFFEVALPITGRNNNKGGGRRIVLQFHDTPGDAKYARSVWSALTLPTVDCIVVVGQSTPNVDAVIQSLNVPCIRVQRGIDYDCATYAGIDELRAKILAITTTTTNSLVEGHQQAVFQVEHVYEGAEIGAVLSGGLLRGSLSVGQTLHFVSSAGVVQPATVQTLHCMREAVESAVCGQPIAMTIAHISGTDGTSTKVAKGTVFAADPQALRFHVLKEICIADPQMTTPVDGCTLFIQGNRLPCSLNHDTNGQWRIRLAQPFLLSLTDVPPAFILLHDRFILVDRIA